MSTAPGTFIPGQATQAAPALAPEVIPDPAQRVEEDQEPIPLEENDWETLLTNIKEGVCTPFLGAGASIPPLPLASTLAEQWSQQYEYPLENSRKDLSRVAQFLAVTHRDSAWPKIQIRDLFNSYSAPDFKSEIQIHSLLAELPLPVYITTNYDDYMTQALILKGKDPKRELCRWNNSVAVQRAPSVLRRRTAWEPTSRSPAVFHLHGYKDVPESMVLTEDDYVDFLIRMDADDQDLLPPRIQEAFTGASLLFLGYGLGDWNFRVLFRTMVTYMERSTKKAHVSVQLAPLDKNMPEENKKAILKYLNNYFGDLGIRVYWGKCNQFTRELRERWNKCVKTSKP